jgi:hypothetical protein
MPLELITDTAAVSRTLASLGLPSHCDSATLVAASLRRAGAIQSPCRAWELSRAVWTSLQPLAAVAGIDADLVDAVLDELLMVGDFAEVLFRADDGNSDDQLLLCLTPPAFVSQQTGTIILLGGSDDGPAGLPSSVSERIVYRGVLRQIDPRDDEDLARSLREFGLIEVAADAWLRLPKRESAAAHIKALLDRMPTPTAGRPIEDLLVLQTAAFSKRWRAPDELTGVFVARRPQLYGLPVWCVVKLHEGLVRSLLDLHAPGSRWRPCDLAWQFQMAFDANAGSPHVFRRMSGAGCETIEVDSPLPSWAERRLRLVGEKTAATRSLLAFAVPGRAASEECQFLQDYLWMQEQRIQG